MLAIARIQIDEDGMFAAPGSSDASWDVTSRRDYLARIGEIHRGVPLEFVRPETTDALRASRLIVERNTSGEFEECDIIALRHTQTGKLTFIALEPIEDEDDDDD